MTPELKNRILDLARQLKRPFEIIDAVGGPHMRNAVMGVLHRNGFKYGKGSGNRKAAPLPCKVAVDPTHRPVGGRGCQFIIGDHRGPDWRFCGEPRVRQDSSYCAAHHAVCYVRTGEVNTFGVPSA